MLDVQTHKLLALFGDAQPHSFFETAKLGCVLLKVSERKLEKLFKRRLLENGWVRRLGQSWDPRLDMYQLTSKGDACFRESQISQLHGFGVEEAKRHYRLFNRDAKGKYGVEGMGETITEEVAKLRERFPHLYG